MNESMNFLYIFIQTVVYQILKRLPTSSDSVFYLLFTFLRKISCTTYESLKGMELFPQATFFLLVPNFAFPLPFASPLISISLAFMNISTRMSAQQYRKKE